MYKKERLITIVCASLAILLVGMTPISSTDNEPNAQSLLGDELIISARNSDEYRPNIAYNSIHQEYLVVWENIWPGGEHDVYAQRVSSTGRLIETFFISDIGNDQMNPTVAYDPEHDRYLVVFSYDFWGNGSDWDIYGRFIPWDGPDPALLAFSICDWGTSQGKPVVAFSPVEDEFMVTWVNYPPGQPTYLSGRRVFSVGGFPPGDGFTITSGAYNRDHQDIAYDLAHNEYLVTWQVDSSDSGWDIWGIRLRADGVPLEGGDPPQVGEFVIAGWPDSEEIPAVATCYPGTEARQYLVAWQSDQVTGYNNYAIYVRYISRTGVPGGIYLAADTTGNEVFPDLDCDSTGNKYLLMWSEEYITGAYGVWARFAYLNETFGPGFQVISPISTYGREYPAVEGGRTNFLTAWEHTRNDGNLDIHGRLIGYFVYLPMTIK
ncbi:MAG TPA: hypothetical protein PLH64_00755 [Anaerolineaceae bacterium]|nr:hypothetical protein [Anaerolineaceae bacterium]